MQDPENRTAQVSFLRALASTINAEIDRYDRNGDRDALTSVAEAAQKLSLSSSSATDRFEDFTLRPLANACGTYTDVFSLHILVHYIGDSC